MTLETLKGWIEDNPLRKYRKKNNVSMMRAASMIGVGMSSVQAWEQGAHQPTRASFELLAKVSGIENIERQWELWLKKKPKL